MSLALECDLYQARMLLGYYFAGMQNRQAIMEAWARKMPRNRAFFVVAGLDRIIDYLANVKIDDEIIEFWKEVFPEITFDESLCNYLKSLDFSTLEIMAMDEGEVAFQNEPFIQVKGPIGMVQFVETKILSVLNHDIRVASKAARVCYAAGDKPVLEFGSRRTHDQAAIDAARAAYIGGCAGTSNMAAWARYGIPISGTQGHVWIQSFATEGEDVAFRKWGEIFPNSVYLIDTYDSYKGMKLIEEMVTSRNNCDIKAIRLDSGDLAEQARFFRQRKSPALDLIKIVASDDLNEYRIDVLLGEGAPIDMFGVGTEIVSTPDSPTCGIIYKLVSIQDKDGNWQNVAKFSSEGKKTLAGPKQVYRYGKFEFDILAQNDEVYSSQFSPLLKRKSISIKDKNLKELELKDARSRAKTMINSMPPTIRELYSLEPYYSVYVSEQLKYETEQAKKRIRSELSTTQGTSP